MPKLKDTERPALQQPDALRISPRQPTQQKKVQRNENEREESDQQHPLTRLLAAKGGGVMKRTIYIALVHTPNEYSDLRNGPLDCTYCEVFSSLANADHWIGVTIAAEGTRNGYTADEMDTQIYEREIYI